MGSLSGLNSLTPAVGCARARLVKSQPMPYHGRMETIWSCKTGVLKSYSLEIFLEIIYTINVLEMLE